MIFIEDEEWAETDDEEWEEEEWQNYWIFVRQLLFFYLVFLLNGIFHNTRRGRICKFYYLSDGSCRLFVWGNPQKRRASFL